MIKRSIMTFIFALFFVVGCGNDEQPIVNMTSTAEPSPTVHAITESTQSTPTPAETPTAVSPLPVTTDTPSPSLTPTATMMPTETAVFFNPTFRDFEPIEDKPGLISRSGGAISALWINIIRLK